MVDRIRDRMSGWFVVTLLGVITTGIGWLIVQNNTRLNYIDSKVDTMDKEIIELRNISSNLVEAYNGKYEKDKEQDKEILELWKTTTRGTRQTTIRQ